MKIRNKLVSNSSSSSFLLFLDFIPQTKQELKEMLFPNDSVFANPFHYGDEPRGWPIEDVIDIIMADFQEAKVLTEKEIVEELTSGWLEEVQPSWEVWDRIGKYPYNGTVEEQREYTRKQSKALEDYRKEEKKLAEKYYKNLPKNKKTICVTYSDEDGSLSCALEHGNTFKNIDHIRISKH